MGQSEVRRPIGDRKRCGRDEIDAVGKPHDGAGVDDKLLAIAAAKARDREHPVARRDMGNAGRYLDDFTRRLQARRERECRLDLIASLYHQDVGKIYAARPHANARLSVAKRTMGNVCPAQTFGRAPLLANNPFHVVTPLTCRPSGRRPQGIMHH